MDEIKIKIVIEEKTGFESLRDEHGNIKSTEKVVVDADNVKKIVVTPETKEVKRRYLRPYVKFVKKIRNSTDLIDRIHNETSVLGEGQVAIVISYKNLDNIAKYHILNTSSNLYYNGSLPKNGTERFKFSDFKFSKTVHLEETQDGWRSVEKDDNGNPVLSFSSEDVKGYEFVDNIGSHIVPPYYIADEDGKTPLWFLEQDKLVPSPNQETWNAAEEKWT